MRVANDGGNATQDIIPRIRSIILVTHRWLDLASSLVLSIVGVTGAILVLPGTSPLKRIAGAPHERLSIGVFGLWIVVVVTIENINPVSRW